jgi:uncharacterized protein YjbI with pentapeptide repeats
MTKTIKLLSLAAVVALAVVSPGRSIGAQEPQNTAQIKQLQETRNCVRCDLSQADLSGMQLPKSDLSGANLFGAKLYKVNLTEANLTYANLTNADFTGADLTGAIGANLSVAKTTERTICPDGSAGPCK